MAMCAGAVVHEATAWGDSVHVFGDVDEANAAEFEDVLQHVVRLSRPLTINLTRCRGIGSLGMRALLRARQYARSEFVTLVDRDSGAARTLEISKMERLLGVRKVETSSAGDELLIVALDGEWDLSRGEELRRHIERALAQPRVVFDMSDVRYIDSHCLGMLGRMHTQRVAKGYRPAQIVLANSNVRKVLGITGLDSILNVYETLNDALADLK